MGMRKFDGLDDRSRLLFADGVAQFSDGNAGVAVLFDAEMAQENTVFGESYPVTVMVHSEASSLSMAETRELRDALSEVLA